MRSSISKAPGMVVLAAGVVLALSTAVGFGVSQAQDTGGVAAAPAEPPQPKQVALSQKSLDGLIAAQKKIRDLKAKTPKDAKAPDPKLEGQIDAAVKKNGFASTGDFADASYSVGVVLAGMDPDSGKYIGADAATKKQVEEVKADKQMPPKEKKEALDELNEVLRAGSTDKPSQGNIDLVTANMSKLNEGLKQAD